MDSGKGSVFGAARQFANGVARCYLDVHGDLLFEWWRKTVGKHGATERRTASLVMVGNLPDKTELTFANSVRGAKIKFGDQYDIRRVVILESEESLQCTDERSQVIRSILGSSCTIVSEPCIDDFRVRAFKTIANELQEKNVQELIVDITNGRRKQTFDLIVATSICRINNVIMTSVPRECFSTPYYELDEDRYTVTTIRPFTQDHSLEAAAQFELIYYTDRIRECVEYVRESPSDFIAGYAETIERSLTNAVVNYFSHDPDDLDNALKRLAELHEGIANRLDREVSGGQARTRFIDVVNRIRSELSEPARVSAAEEDAVDDDQLAAVMLGDILDFCRQFRNYVAHPYHRRIGTSEVRLMVFVTFTLIEQTTAVVSWLARTRDANVHSN